MGAHQFVNTLSQIWNSDSTAFIPGAARHLTWQVRRLLRTLPGEVQISESRLAVPARSGVAALINCMGMYDYNNMHLLQFLLAQWGGVFVDVGANIGSYTLVASEIRRARVISIEANPRTFAILQQNIQLNHRANVQAYPLALSDREGTLWISDAAQSEINRVLDVAEKGNEGFQVPCRTLAGLCVEAHIQPQWVKIDVEGHEQAVLKGMGQELNATRLFWIENGESPPIREMMAANGYVGPLYCHFKQKTLMRTPQRRAEDCIYIRPGEEAELSQQGFTVQK